MGTGIVDQLHDVIDALADLDIDALPDDALDDLTIRLQCARHRLDAATATVCAAAGIGAVCGGSDGSRSAAARLARDASTSLPRARRDPRRAHHLATMPVLAEAVGDGRLSMDHVDLLAAADTTALHGRLSSATKRCSSNTAQQLRFAQAVQRRLLEAARRRHRRTTTPTSRRPPTPPASTPPPCWTASSASTGTSTRSAAPPSSPSSTASMRLAGTWLIEAAGVTRSGGAAPRRRVPVEMATRSASTPQSSWRLRPIVHRRVGRRQLRPTSASWPTAPSSLPATSCRTSTPPCWKQSVLFADPLTAVGVSPHKRNLHRPVAARPTFEVRTRHCEPTPPAATNPYRAATSTTSPPTPTAASPPTVQRTARMLAPQPLKRDAPRPRRRRTAPRTRHHRPLPTRATLRWKLKHEHPNEWAWLTDQTPRRTRRTRPS